MRRFFLPTLALASILLWFSPLMQQNAAAQCDSVSMTKKSAIGCTNWLIQNRNAQNETINRIRFEIVTPGVSWAGSASAGQWTVLQLAPNIIEFDGGASGLRGGVDMPIRLVCLERLCSTDSDYRVKWTTYNGGTLLCSGFVDVSCEALATSDSLATMLDAADWQCHHATLFNRNSLNLQLEGLRLTMLTPGVNMNTTAPSGWQVASSTAREAFIEANPDPLQPGDSLPGMRMCFSQIPPGIDTVALLWESYFFGVALSFDTLHVRLGRQPRCDSLVVSQRAGSVDPACKEVAVFNLHEPQSPVTSFTLQIVTPGAVFVTGATGPWNLTQETSKFLRYASTSGGIANADSASGFGFCILNASSGNDVLLRLTTYDGNRELCSVEANTFIPAVDGVCDRFTARRVGGNSYVLGFLNRRQPALPLDGFSFALLNSGPTVAKVTPASKWTTTASSSTGASFNSGSPVFPGGAIDGFAVDFATTQPDSVVLELCTTAGGTDACCDTLVLPITTGESRCDSLVLEEAPSPDACSWRTGFVNTHLPASQTTRFQLQSLTIGGRFTASAIPAGWLLLDDGSSGTLTLQRDTATATGLSFDLAVQSPDASTIFEWCTADANGPICCGIDSVYCPPAVNCGTLETRVGSTTFEREVRFRNELSPASAVDVLQLAVATAGSAFASLQLPANWTVTYSAAKDTARIEPDAAIATDSISPWFTVTLLETPGCDSIRWNWTALRSGSALCSAAIPAVACPSTSCDTLTFAADTERPCCFNISVRNGGSGEIDGVILTVLTDDASIFASTLEAPEDWTQSGDSLYVQWNTTTMPVISGTPQDGFTVCFNNRWIENRDFRVAWQTMRGRTTRCTDTLTIACDRTLTVEHLDAPLPGSVMLQQNYPNPFSGTTSIVFALPREENVTLRVYDMHGRLVASLCSGRYAAGSYRLDFDGGKLPAGMYLLRLSTGEIVKTRMMSLIR